ncbi:hypothetical protein MVEN_00460000 [Mycena venus]|uniref:Uncharacterized protein n=1 Tax=Mycena venus TaxID=2733690 RepID=A0A8H6YX05_9AGAR|nr:hypothetical protein MVEN_00460000 [Mycena venus]
MFSSSRVNPEAWMETGPHRADSKLSVTAQRHAILSSSQPSSRAPASPTRGPAASRATSRQMSSRPRSGWTRSFRWIYDWQLTGRTRLLLESEGPNPEEDDEEAAERAVELALKFSRRPLGTNADRYVEPEPVLDSYGGALIAHRMRAGGATRGRPILVLTTDTADDEDVDHTLVHTSSGIKLVMSPKGKVGQIEWDKELDELEREKAAAEAIWPFLFPSLSSFTDSFPLDSLNLHTRPKISLPRQTQICHRHPQPLTAPRRRSAPTSASPPR